MKSGDIINNTLVIREKINSGGFGNIWKAEDRTRNMTVAVKQLKGKWNHSPQMLRFFEEEFSTQYRLAHPHVVRSFYM